MSRLPAARLWLWALAGAVTFGAPQAPTQATNPPAPTGIVIGTVVDAQTGTPISSVAVAIGGVLSAPPPANGRPRSIVTDSQGRFAFRQLPPGGYTIQATASANGYSPTGFIVSGSGFPIGPYLPGGYGQRRPNGPLQPIDLKDGEHLVDLVIRMWKPAAITGTVVDEADEPQVGQVVGAVQVSSDGRLLTGPTTRTDDRGAYRFGTLVPGTYLVFVPQTQLLVPVDTADALSSPTAEPTAVDKLKNTGAPDVRQGVTIGDVRLATGTQAIVSNGLAPRADGAAWLAYPTTFAAAATSAARATRIVAKAGEEQSNVVVRVQPQRAYRVSGTLTDASGPAAGFGVHLLPADAGDGSSVLEVARTSTDGRGQFVFPLVPAGAYQVVAMRVAPVPSGDRTKPFLDPTRVAEMPGAWAAQPVTVANGDMTGLALTLRAGAKLSARVVFDGASRAPTPDVIKRVTVSLEPSRPVFRDSGAPRLEALVNENSQADVVGIPPGRYVVRVPEMPGWSLQSVTVGGRDVTDAAIAIESADLTNVQITYSDRENQLSGTVQGATSPSDADAAVVLFPADRSRWPDARKSTRTFRIVRTAATGAFRINTLVPGDYLVAAIADAGAVDWPDEAFIAKVAALATAVRVTTGANSTISLRTVTVR